MTERLYYEDSFLREFEAEVLSCEAAHPEGSRGADNARWQVVLDRTALYPTSGGQPHDTGTLDGAAVVEVLERDDQTVAHLTNEQVPAGRVRGAIDWERRFDHMQQHTGQHLLSATFLELFKFPTVSFHLGREGSTIDLAAPGLDARLMEQAERHTNLPRREYARRSSARGSCAPSRSKALTGSPAAAHTLRGQGRSVWCCCGSAKR